ncbi:MAG: rod shape-determining protein MreC [Actinomycetota bacterium]|nr:rod shape-determining protein MreC [Actinomycetota bacterium]MDH5225454.1 rod shape-determining protein MreC [Actinomycetota bacterium]MDH5313282.1 rod shape-determining protein MreC [Actinomycetota bacterium]
MVTRQRPRSTRLLVVALVSISLAVITLDYRQGDSGPLAGIGGAAKAFMAPMQEAVTTATEPVGDFFSGLANLPSLADENERLKEEIAALTSKIQSDGYEQAQYQGLLDLLELSQALDPPVVAAVVVGNGVSNFEYTITINKGSNDGIAKDQPVATGSADAQMLVGRVVAVTPNSADVRLIIDRDYAVAATIEGTREAGLVTGQGDQDLRMGLVEPGTVVEGDESVFTQSYELNGEAGLYPPGMLIGQVSRFVPAENVTQEYVEVRPAVDFETLQFVLVLQSRTEA